MASPSRMASASPSAEFGSENLDRLLDAQHVFAPEWQHGAQHQPDVFLGDVRAQKPAEWNAGKHNFQRLSHPELHFLVINRLLL